MCDRDNHIQYLSFKGPVCVYYWKTTVYNFYRTQNPFKNQYVICLVMLRVGSSGAEPGHPVLTLANIFWPNCLEHFFRAFDQSPFNSLSSQRDRSGFGPSAVKLKRINLVGWSRKRVKISGFGTKNGKEEQGKAEPSSQASHFSNSSKCYYDLKCGGVGFI